MNKPLRKIHIDLELVFTTAFIVKALYTGTWQDCMLVAIMITFGAYRIWIKTKTTKTDIFEKRISELETEVSTLKSAIALRRSY